jgi:SNF2 family DNA or RNA helicase
MKMTIAFNIQEFEKNIFLPSAWLVQCDENGKLAHRINKINAQQAKNQGLSLSPEQFRCLEIIETLSPSNLEKKYCDKKQKLSLLQLLAKREVLKTVRGFVDRHLDVFLQTIAKHQLPLCYQIESKAVTHLTQVNYAERAIIPHLSFRKINEGVLYQLKFEENNVIWKINEKNIVAIVNEPAWLLIDNELVRLYDINALLVNPFKDKYEVFITQAQVRTYFETFIMKIVSKVKSLETEGFDIIDYQTIKKVYLRLDQHFMLQEWGFNLQFEYENGKDKTIRFAWYESQNQKNRLEFSPNDDIIIHKTQRNLTSESAVIQNFEALGIKRATTNLFSLDTEKKDFHSHLNWLISNKQAIENQGIVIEKVMVENKEIAILNNAIAMNLTSHNDWFDLQGQIEIGEWAYPFSKFVPYLKDGNQFFPLPDGTFFIIPQEWFSKYKALAQFGKTEGNRLKIVKSQQSLLAKAGFENITNQEEWIEDETLMPSEKIAATLRPYQLHGFRWLVHHFHQNQGACLADDMGLGKTLQTIAAIQYAKEQKSLQKAEAKPMQLDFFAVPADEDFLNPVQVLIILPASLVFNWKAELYKFAKHLSVLEHIGNKRNKDIRILKRYDVVLTTYQTALKDEKLLGDFEWEYIILDESHYIKNPESQAFKAIAQFKARHKISLSGTPIENSLADLWAQMQFINPETLGTLNSFRTHFIKAIEKDKNQEKRQQLHDLVQPFLLRRTKSEVAKDLPDLIEQVVYVEMSNEQAKLYEQERSSARNLLLQFDEKNFQQKSQMLNALIRLKQIANHPALLPNAAELGVEKLESAKFDEVIEHWETIQKAGHKMLIFSHFTKHLALYQHFLEQEKQPFSYLSGALNVKEREQNIQEFKQNADNQTFLMSLKAGGVGLNLTEASYVLMLDPWWNPQVEKQAIARAHRIGQDKTVIALKFITKGTIEEKILKLQEHKVQLAEDILDANATFTLTKSEIAMLLD